MVRGFLRLLTAAVLLISWVSAAPVLATVAEFRVSKIKTNDIISKGPVVDARAYGVVGDCSTNDTAAIAAAYAEAENVFFPKPPGGCYSVDSITLGDNQALLTAGRGVAFKQRPGNVGTRVINVAGSNVTLGDMIIEGNIAVDTDEQNHGIFIRGSADISGISIGNITGKNIRGDVIYVGGLATAGVFDVRISSVFADNVLRNGISVIGGQGVTIGSVTGTAVGFLMFDIEPNSNSQQTDSIRVDYIRGGAAGVIGYGSTVIAKNVYIGALDLDPTFQPNSTPAYANYDLETGLLIRSTYGLRVGFFKASGFEGRAADYIYSAGDVDGQNIVFDRIDWSNCSTTDVVYNTYAFGAFGDLTINAGAVSLLNSNKVMFFGDAGDLTRVRLDVKNLKINGKVARYVSNSTFDNITVDTTNDTYLFQNMTNSVISNSRMTAGRLAGSSSKLTFKNINGSFSTLVFPSGENDHLVENSTINGLYYGSGWYLYPAGRKVAVPATATTAGTPGDWAANTSYFYVYTGDGTTHSWRRVGVVSW